MQGQNFAISYHPGLAALFVVLGIGPRRARVTLDGDSLRARMGWAFDLRIPRSSIVSSGLDDRRVTGWGVHGWGGRWLVNGSSTGLVQLEITPPQRGRLLMVVPIRVRQLRLSLTDPRGFLNALQP